MVLGSLIDSGIMPVARLTRVFRQAGHSRIITTAHRINEGHMPEILQSHGPQVRARMPKSSAARSSVNCLLAGQMNLRFDTFLQTTKTQVRVVRQNWSQELRQ
jgi:hypothetical protein